MTTERYNEVKEGLPSSLRMKLDHIKRYLDQGKAAVMVGAGFSKNALMPEAAEMKDWNALGLDFYRRLYGQPKEGSLMFQNPISLATQVEASFGRHELDDLIQQSLPDDEIVPSQLHIDLLNLGWHDIFTTNYDTLLERACLDADHPQTIVNNKDTLLYSLSPRIVKLHGSFPNIRPYIITEEDYRTYPQRYPEFVNTVRQSLIENLFCLIGFSGDDPNFKSWLGWLRDVMGQRISPVYFITFDGNLYAARRNLLASQRIEVLNLHDLPTIGNNIQDAFNFFFSYLRNESNTQWRGQLGTLPRKIETVDQVRNLTSEMAAIRISYPNWLVLPEKYYEEFRDTQSLMLSSKGVAEIEDIKKEELLEYLYELKWRLEVSLTPIGTEWYVSALEGQDLDMAGYEPLVMDLKLSLLNHYRIIGDEDKYNALVNILGQRKQVMKPNQLRRFFYDRCLMASSKMQNATLRSLLSDWQVFETDFEGAMWKSSMLMEADQRGEALNVLTRASVQLRRTMLSNPQESYFYRSCQIAIERALRIYKREAGNGKEYTSCDYLTEMKYFKEKLQEVRKKKQMTKTHGFNVDDVKTTWHFGSAGYVESFLYPYRYYALCELVGMPVGTVEYLVNTKDHEAFLPQYIKYNHYFPVGILARSCNEKLVDEVLGRRVMSAFSRELANEYFDNFFAYANQLDKLQDRYIRAHIFKTCIPILVRLSSKASSDKVKQMALYLLDAHLCFAMNEETLEQEYVKTIYHALTKGDMNELLSKIFERPIVLTNYREADYFIPMGRTGGVSFTTLAVDEAVNGLTNPDDKVQEAAFLRAYQILRGEISDDDRNRLKTAIINWRNNTKQMQHVVFSFIDVPVTEGEKYTPEGLLQENLNELLAIDVSDIRNTSTYDRIAQLYQRICYSYALLGGIDPTSVIRHFVKIVTSNEELLRNDDVSFLCGFRGNMTQVVEEFENFVSNIDLTRVPVDVVQSLTDAVNTLHSLNYPHFMLLLTLRRFDNRLNESKLKKEMQDVVTSSATLTQAMDIAKAIEVMHLRRGSYQEVVHRIVSICEYSTDQSVSSWLYALYFLMVRKAVKATSKSKFDHLLNAIFVNDNYSDAEAEVLADIRHGASRLAGAMARKWGDSEATDRWKSLSADDSGEFNDISHAFETAW